MIYWQWGTIQVNNYQSNFQNGIVEINMDAGIPMKRMRFTSVQNILEGTFTLNKDDKLEFESWYKFDIKQGELEFQYYDCEYSAYKTVRLVDKPKITSNSNYFDVYVKFIYVGGA